MTMQAKIEVDVRPRLVNKTGLASYMGYSLGGFSRKLPELQKMGFPEIIEGLDRFDLNQVDQWLDLRNAAQLATSEDITGIRAKHGRKSAF